MNVKSIKLPENFGVQSEESKRLHAAWRAETDWRLKMMRHPDLGLSLQRVINASVVSEAGEAVANYLRTQLFPNTEAAMACEPTPTPPIASGEEGES